MIYLGIDQSLTSLGLAIISPVSQEPLVLENIEPGPLRGGERLFFLKERIHHFIGTHKITQSAMEGYSMGSTHQAFSLGEIGGVVKCLLAELKIPCIDVAPLALKKFICNNVGAEKADVSAGILRKFNLRIDQNDRADAYVLARVAAVYDTGISIYREELEVVHSLKKPSVAVLKPRRGKRGNTL